MFTYAYNADSVGSDIDMVIPNQHRRHKFLDEQ